MKTINFKHTVAVTLCVGMLAGLWACSTDSVDQHVGKLPDKEPLANTYGFLNSSKAAEREVDMLLPQGDGFMTDMFYYQITKPIPAGLSLDIRADLSEQTLAVFNAAREIEHKAQNPKQEYVPFALLPEANYELPDGKTLDIAQDGKRSASKRIKVLAKDLAPGSYLLPVTVSGVEQTGESQTLYYTITIRQPQMGDFELHNGDDLFFVFYINTSQYQPLLVDDYFMQKKLARGSTVAWYNVVGNIINLRTVRLDYEAETGRAKLNLGPDMRYVLDHVVKYIRPLQDKGRKVCISIEGGGTGIGFCNLTDAQIADFAAQIKAVIETYGLDGINLWDRDSGYGTEGMPAMNTTSYPKLIKALRQALGAEKMLTVTVHEKPTETFHDVAASGGIAVGEYIDYAWSGYNDNQKAVQLLDPWNTDLPYVSDYTQKPIANLPAERFGCVNFPIYPGTSDPIEATYREPEFLVEWIINGYKPNQIIVFDDLRTILQDRYETYWNMVFQQGCTRMDDQSSYILGNRAGYSYTFDINRSLTRIPDGEGSFIGGYGKWLKDW